MAQHDHSAHTFVFGPDGKLYLNFGNTGEAVHDKNGKPVVDVLATRSSTMASPIARAWSSAATWTAPTSRCSANNFRNNYEVAVDSFGTLWQSDNDDDGNRGVRINYVMEYGNYGYTDEMTGAGWQSPRTNMENEIPLRHWHLNDPGVVPNLLQTGAGSPTGICVYEGRLLPKVFHNQMIHCDAGPEHRARLSGEQKRRRLQGDDRQSSSTATRRTTGSAPSTSASRPTARCSSPTGTIRASAAMRRATATAAASSALRRRATVDTQCPVSISRPPRAPPRRSTNPCLSVRYLAWTSLQQMGVAAEPELVKLWQNSDSRIRARALWLLGRIDGKSSHYVEAALKDADPDIRITGLRLARALKLDMIPLVRQLVADPDAAVLRECAIALRHEKSAEAPSCGPDWRSSIKETTAGIWRPWASALISSGTAI